MKKTTVTAKSTKAPTQQPKPKMKIKFYRDHDRFYRWSIITRNGRVRADCGEGYTNLRDCVEGLMFVLNEKRFTVVCGDLGFSEKQKTMIVKSLGLV